MRFFALSLSDWKDIDRWLVTSLWSMAFLTIALAVIVFVGFGSWKGTAYNAASSFYLSLTNENQVEARNLLSRDARLEWDSLLGEEREDLIRDLISVWGIDQIEFIRISPMTEGRRSATVTMLVTLKNGDIDVRVEDLIHEDGSWRLDWPLYFVR